MSGNGAWKNMLLGGGVLAAFAIVGVTVVAMTWRVTEPRIKHNEKEVLVRTLHQVIPPTAHDNDLLDSIITVTNLDLLGTREPVKVYRAFDHGKPVAVLMTPVAPNGYGGEIHLLVGILADGRIAGVRVLSHKETPGLGDAIEIDKSPWITSFSGRSIGNPPLDKWQVKRDGGAFDQFTGATITPRAVVQAVRNTLIYFQAHHDELFATGSAAGSQNMETDKP